MLQIIFKFIVNVERLFVVFATIIGIIFVGAVSVQAEGMVWCPMVKIVPEILQLNQIISSCEDIPVDMSVLRPEDGKKYKVFIFKAPFKNKGVVNVGMYMPGTVYIRAINHDGRMWNREKSVTINSYAEEQFIHVANIDLQAVAQLNNFSSIERLEVGVLYNRNSEIERIKTPSVLYFQNVALPE